MDEDENLDRGEPIVSLSPKWISLIDELWITDDRSIVNFLPKIVAMIKSTKSASVAETGLFTVLHSPKVQGLSKMFELLTPATVVPTYLACEQYADAARVPLGKARKDAEAKFKRHSRAKALTMQDAVKFFERFEAATDEASTERAKRARRKLGVSRPRGRPKKNGQE